ncbi:hypothetical protein BIV57_15635 [Mangrovactinospora gilvigrisea]|uniref:Helix-hairpin-helix domain-containing protein n=1 Tax=Mangrovactinospora gilvigrisea TaxID=1428644 RepID=A0A1J7C4U5_9ACTN|nr:helix-hairpin-helix domain-containing protein [Mangrovactinospora gilvigrisea]OIV36584.1 hypothetical protein BIV57_15635 [Mangrovactinospora gilvigrisea]
MPGAPRKAKGGAKGRWSGDPALQAPVPVPSAWRLVTGRGDGIALQAELAEEQARRREARRGAGGADGGAEAVDTVRAGTVVKARGAQFELSRAAWSLVPVVSFGLATPVPFLRRACALGERRGTGAFAGYLMTTLLSWFTIALAPEESDALAMGSLLLFVSTVVGSVHTFLTFRETWEAPAPARVRGGAAVPGTAAGSRPVSVEDRNREAVAEARARLRRRRRARRLALRRPALARELRIGRGSPAYDDGGLVDVNHADADMLVRRAELTAAEAAAVVAARERLGGRFSSVAELAVYAELSEGRLAEVADRLLCVGG